jgi:DNA-binding XRE family transcriptional regulator
MKNQAYNLYFQTGLTQQQIAAILGVNRKTLYNWIHEGDWKRARNTARHAPTLLVQQYYDQLTNLNASIAARTDNPFPTKDEADVMRKLSLVIKQVRTSWSPSDMMDIFTLFTQDLIDKGHQSEAIAFIPLLDQFVTQNTSCSKNYDPMTKYYNKMREDESYRQWLNEQNAMAIPTPEETTPPAAEPSLPTPPAPAQGTNGVQMGHTPGEAPPPDPLINNGLSKSGAPVTPLDKNNNGAQQMPPEPGPYPRKIPPRYSLFPVPPRTGKYKNLPPDKPLFGS